VLLTGLCGAIPATPGGAIWFVLQMAAAQVFLAGVVTVRSAVWKLNYPRTHRGQITARIQRVRSIGSVLGLLFAGVVLDHDAASYRYIFPFTALCGAIGVYLSTRIHVRGDRFVSPRQRESLRDGLAPPGWVEPFNLTALLSPGHVLGQMRRVLRDDRRFLQYCIAQSLTGISNLMTISVAVAVVTRELNPGEEWGFWISTALISVFQNLAMMGSVSRWGRLFDDVGVLRFRVINVFCWAAGVIFGLLGTLAIERRDFLGGSYFIAAVTLFALRGIANGFGQGGGAVAWNLGHLDFARPEEAEIYMGIHVSLTGLRGLVAPLVGMWLWRSIDWSVWLIALALSIGSLAAYAWMARLEKRMGISSTGT
jgi:hypothetical protein